jgi:PKD domain
VIASAFRHSTIAAILTSAFFLAACGGTHTVTPTGAPPSANTTLQAETANNTSAASSFTAQTNGNAGAGNVSKVATNSLLYGGSNTKVYVTWLGWFGRPDHMTVGYNSGSAAQVHAQVADMVSRGIQGAIAAWYGPGTASIDNATMLLKHEAEAQSGKFEFAIMEDVGALGAAAMANGCNVTNQVISDLGYIQTQYESSPAYMRMNGSPVVFFFDVDSYYIDWNRVVASAPGNPLLIFRGNNGFTRALSNGGFSWVNIQSSNPFDPELNLQDSFYQAAQQATQRLAFGSVFKGFNDTLASWGTNRVIDQNCAQTWLETFSEIGNFYSSARQLPAIQIATWNDYEEGTAIEPGIDNCVYLVPSQSGSVINWAVNGNENTIDHYTVFISTDGQNLSPLADVARGTHALDLSKMTLSTSQTYSLYVKAIGVPSVENKMAPPIAYRSGDQPPSISLNVSETGSLTYTASISSSSGNVARSSIDFGDGTVGNGPTAVHTYNAVGNYLVTGNVFDAAGASSVDVQRISAKSSSAGIAVVSPANNSTVNWPTPIVASANPGTPTMRVLIDGQQAYASHGDTLTTGLKIFTGTHQISVQSLDSAGNATATASLNVNAEPGDLPPVASVVLTAMPAISPTTVLGCMANSYDPDGFPISYKLHYSDGSQFSTIGALETFPAPGIYSATATVMDQFGATSTTSTTFTLSAGGISSIPGPVSRAKTSSQHQVPIQPMAPPEQ